MDCTSDQLELLLPVAPGTARIAREPSALTTLRNTLRRTLKAMSPFEDVAAERVIMLMVVSAQVQGIVSHVGVAAQPLLASVVGYFVNRPTALQVDLELRSALITSVEQASKRLQRPPFHSVPAWQEAPVVRWLWEFAGTRLFPRGLVQAQSNLT